MGCGASAESVPETQKRVVEPVAKPASKQPPAPKPASKPARSEPVTTPSPAEEAPAAQTQPAATKAALYTPHAPEEGDKGEEGSCTMATEASVLSKLELSKELVFDTAFAMEQVGDDVDFVVELADSIIELHTDVQDSCKKAIQSKDWKEIFEKAHSLKGAVSNLGINRIRAVAFALEQSGRHLGEGDEAASPFSPAELPHLLTILQAEWTEYQKVFKAETERLRAES
eukprot:TRINITY_DN18307_c0_g1_i1.p2 TRINITY_DN18307_c0_g1~~TRINITY_DN18307_c0_g1_i1.p2  ORF type:complete len:228 (+),score=33.42 TRINITY_DN18307_c0_g1_i1:186-869(+)